jgi:hypothetical protein
MTQIQERLLPTHILHNHSRPSIGARGDMSEALAMGCYARVIDYPCQLETCVWAKKLL